MFSDKVATVMSDKVITVESGSPLDKAIKKMAKRNIGSIIVMEGRNIAGLITERDLLGHMAAGKTLDGLAVNDLMTSKIIMVRADQTIAEATQLLLGHHIRRLPVMEKDHLIGIITATDMTFEMDYSDIRGDAGDYMSKTLYYISQSDTVLMAAKKMVSENIGGLLVGSEKKIDGIITERDMLRNVIAKERDFEKTKVEDVMSRDILTVEPKTKIRHTCHLMHYYGIRRFPVVDDDNKPLGMITERDMLAAILETLKKS